MALVNRSFSVNVTPGMMPQTVHVSEYDVGRAYTVSILDENGNTFVIPTGTTAEIVGTLNNSVAFPPVSATVTTNNTVTFNLTEAMTAYSGKAWCKIKLTQNSQPIQTCAFVLAVDRAGVEAETVIGAPGFEEQIADAAAEWMEQQGFTSPTVTITPITGGNRVTFTDADGSESMDVMNGEDGFVLPSGGQAGQALISDGEGGAEWGAAQGAGLSDEAKTALVAFLETVYVESDDGKQKLITLKRALDMFNKLVDGTYESNGGHESWQTASLVTISGGNEIEIASTIGAYKYFSIPFKNPISVNTGDFVEFISVPVVSKSAGFSVYRLGSFDSLGTYEGNLSFSQEKTTSYTADADAVADSLSIMLHALGEEMIGASAQIAIRINGEEVLA